MTRFDRWMPTLVMTAVAVLVTYIVTSSAVSARYTAILDEHGSELRLFEERFAGQPKSSELDEEWLIREFFNDRREGVFLDVGARLPIYRHTETKLADSNVIYQAGLTLYF